jgi:TonB family protein
MTVPSKDFTLPALIPPQTQPHSAGTDYVPPGIVSVAYPGYPRRREWQHAAVAWGVAIIRVTVSSTGTVENTEVLHGSSPFTDLALSAVGKFQFQAATLRGKPVRSKLAVAFVFDAPQTPS